MAQIRRIPPAFTAALAVMGLLVVVNTLVSTLLDGTLVSLVIDDGAQLLAGLSATAAAAITGLRHRGRERAWRLLLAVGTGGWSIGQSLWAYYRIFEARDLPSPSWADVGYLTLPVFALPALLAFATIDRPSEEQRRTRSVVVLDSMIVVCSALGLTWITALGAVVKAGAPSALAFAVAVAYPVTDLVLVAIVVIIGAILRAAPRHRWQLFILGLGLVGVSVSDSIFAYLVASGADRMKPLSSAGFVIGPALLGMAVCLKPTPLQPNQPRPIWRNRWIQLLLPYLPLAAAGIAAVIRTAMGRPLAGVEVYVGFVMVSLVVCRQLITLVDNARLLDRVRDGQELLTYHAFHDALTGLPNRTLFADRLTQAVAAHRRLNRPLALVFVDLDDFKVINDSYGHAGGDQLLVSVAQRLRACTRATDTVARLGGDEFALLLEGDFEAPTKVGQRVLEAFSHPFDLDGNAVTLGVSLGMANPSGEADLTADALLRRADAAMYAGKRNGKNSLVMWPETDPVRVNGLPRRRSARTGADSTASLLAAAVRGEPDAGQIEVHYQPIVRISDGATVAVEALARWNRGEESISPEEFIQVAETAGLVGELDDLVLHLACAEMGGLRTESAAEAAGADRLALHVNISASRLDDPALTSRVIDALDRTGMPGHLLVLEVTETSRVPDLSAAAVTTQRLRRLGVRIALDDFGAGCHTLAHLHLLHADLIKLDRTLTVIGPNERVEALRRSIVAITTDLGVQVIAEGIETQAQANELMRLGYPLGQGYLFSRPAPLDQLHLQPANAIPSQRSSPEIPSHSY